MKRSSRSQCTLGSVMKLLPLVSRRPRIETALEEKIKELTAKCDEHLSPENLNDLEILQTEYD